MLYVPQETSQGIASVCLGPRRLFMQCDERFPVCLHCSKGGRECVYPLQLGFVGLAGSGKAASTHTPETPFDDEEDPVRSPSLSGADIVDSLKARIENIDDEGIRAGRLITRVSGVPRSPNSTKHQAIQFFIKFHQTSIVPQHYFRFYDYHQLHLKHIPSMSENSRCLSYAVSAFSAMVYSAQVNPKAREVSFYLYSMAVKELYFEVAEIEIKGKKDNLNELVAAALELAVTDV